MPYLLDTHAFLWWTLDDPRLSSRARAVMGDMESDLLLSAASVWEIAIKAGLGKLALQSSITRVTIEEPDRNGIQSLPISREHACRTGELPPLHRDPFDRILVAQAQLEDLVLVTCDAAIAAYEVRTLW